MEDSIYSQALRVFTTVVFIAALIIVPTVMLLWLRHTTKDTSNTGLRVLSEVVDRFVVAAETYFGSEAGQEKKAWVIAQVVEWAKKKGIPIEESLLDAMVEAAVYLLINGPEGSKTKEVKAAVDVAARGGDARALPFVKGEAPVDVGPPPIVIQD